MIFSKSTTKNDPRHRRETTVGRAPDVVETTGAEFSKSIVRTSLGSIRNFPSMLLAIGLVVRTEINEGASSGYNSSLVPWRWWRPHGQRIHMQVHGWDDTTFVFQYSFLFLLIATLTIAMANGDWPMGYQKVARVEGILVIRRRWC